MECISGMTERLTVLRETLKTLDVRGFDSMDKLVGCVMEIDRILSEISEDKDGR